MMEKLKNEGFLFEKINMLKTEFPELFNENELEVDKLLDIFSERQVTERFGLTWVGKKSALNAALVAPQCTLLPVYEKSINWENTENLYIEGDNLEVLKCLQKTYNKKVKFIYIDPPYNTGQDFVYKDDFKNSYENYLNETKQTKRANPESSGRFHSEWLNMMYPRLYIARSFLKDDGIICLSIDDNELQNLKFICDEIFGSDNCLGVVPRITKKSGKAHSSGFAKNHDYILIYAKNIYECELNGIDSEQSAFNLQDEYVDKRGKYKLNQTLDYDSLWYNTTMDFPITVEGKTYYPGGSLQLHNERHAGNHNPKDWVWRWSQAKFDFGYANGFVVIKEGKDRPRIYTKTYLNAKIGKDSSGHYCIEYMARENNVSSLNFVENKYSNDNAKKELAEIIDPSLFDFPKPVSLIKSLIELVDCKDMIIMDFFSGSATTAQAVYELNKDGNNRKYILVQLPEKLEEESKAVKEYNLSNLCDLAQFRLKTYLNKSDSQDLFALEQNVEGFKVFKLESTNIKPWDGNVVYNTSSIFDLDETIKEGRTNLDVAYEIMLKYGIFNMQLKEVLINNKNMYSIGDGYMIICLDDNITLGDVSEIAKQKPRCVVFKESGLADDNVKMNATYTLERLGVEDIKCI